LHAYSELSASEMYPPASIGSNSDWLHFPSLSLLSDNIFLRCCVGSSETVTTTFAGLRAEGFLRILHAVPEVFLFKLFT